MIIDVRDGQVDVDGYLFHLKCRDADWLSDEVDDEAHVGALDGFVNVITDCLFGTVPIRIEIHDSQPAELEPHWQHAVEVSLTTTGVLEVRCWTDPEPAFTVAVPSGPIRMRALWTGLYSPTRWGEDGGNLDEAMTFQIWPTAPAEPVVLRWWPDWRLPERSPFSADGRRQLEDNKMVVSRLGELRRLPMTTPTDRNVPFPGDSEDPGRLSRASGIPGGSLIGVLGDVVEGSWWADGYSARRTLREITDDELRAIMVGCNVYSWPLYRLPESSGHNDILEIPADHPRPASPADSRLTVADGRWLEMLKRVGYPTAIIDI